MISERYSLDEFLDAVKEMDWPDIIVAASREVEQGERRAYGARGAVKAREMGIEYYIDEVGRFLFFIGQGMKPGNVSDWEFESYRPICENLVKKGQFIGSVPNFL